MKEQEITINNKPISWKTTRVYMQEDKKRLMKYFETHHDSLLPRFYLLYPSYQVVFLYRISSFFSQRGNPWIARLFWHLNLLLTGADISPISRIGAGLIFIHPQGCSFIGFAGKNLTLLGQCGIGGGLADTDIGAGPGIPILGDDVSLSFGALVLGPVRIGDRVKVGPRCMITKDTPADTYITNANPIVRTNRSATGA